MKKAVTALAIALILTGSSLCQDLTLQKANGVGHLTINASGEPDRSSPRQGGSIWNNLASTSWFTGWGNYIWLDWGKLTDQGNGLPDEVIDGFRFAYATEDPGTSSISCTLHFYDSYTGWCDRSVVAEALFAFTGLPGTGGLPIAYWMWVVTVDLEGSGYEFLLGDEIGIGHQCTMPQPTPYLTGPCLGLPPNCGGNGDTGTEDAFEILYPNGNWQGCYWFGGYPGVPYASFRAELLGGQDPADNMAYAGIGWQGNDAALYAIGSWTAGDTVRFLLRQNEMNQASWILASTTFYWPPLYVPWYDVTLGPRMPFLSVLAMTPDSTGDFASQVYSVGPNAASRKIYMQGAITDVFNGGPIEPLELSNSLIAN